jgi:hypothetical protein
MTRTAQNAPTVCLIVAVKAEAVASRENAQSAQTFTTASEQELRTVLSPLLSREERFYLDYSELMCLIIFR